MRKILMATDFSKGCDNALQYLTDAVSGKRILVDIMHVYDIPLIDQSQVPYKAVEGLKAEKREAATKRLNGLMGTLPTENRGDIHAVFGIYPSTEITELAEAIDADMILMALRRNYGLLDRMIGSITAHTIHKSKKPVMAIPGDAAYSGLSHILFPSTYHFMEDLSEEEESALSWLYDFWELFANPTIHLLHIDVGKHGDKTDVTFTDKPYTSMKFTLSSAPSVHDGIIQAVQKEQPDLLAFYKPNRSFWERLYHRSDTKKILYECQVPIIVFG